MIKSKEIEGEDLQFAHMKRGEDSHLGVVELHGVIGGQGDHQSLLVELQQRALVVF